MEDRVMGKMKGILILAAILALIGVACQETPNLVEPQKGNLNDLAAFGIPPGATFESATFNIYVEIASGRTVNVHRITAPWEEMVVTWNNFGSSFNPGIEGSFLSDGAGWRSADISSLVAGWLNGTNANYGLLLDQGTSFPLSQFTSLQGIMHWPYLHICYSLEGVTMCEDVVTIGDSYIWQFTPDTNRGASDMLYAGWVNESGLEKQALLNFDLVVTQQPAAIGDRVWFDDNMNGLQDDGELGVPDATVQLLDCAGNVLATTTTDANGLYLFSNLVPGDYLIHFVAPEGYAFTLQDQGTDDAVDSDANPTTGLAWCTNLAPGETDLTWDAGVYLIPQEGCTLTIGFWKTHAGFGPQPDLVTQYLPIWLGTAGGSQSINVTNAQIAVNVLGMSVYGTPSNGITKLYAQLLGTKLNIANGADGSSINATINSADAFLATHFWTSWDSLSKSNKKLVLTWTELLDDYNNGDIGPGHCG